MAPTRELATQIQAEAEKFGNPLGINSVCMSAQGLSVVVGCFQWSLGYLQW